MGVVRAEAPRVFAALFGRNCERTPRRSLLRPRRSLDRGRRVPPLLVALGGVDVHLLGRVRSALSALFLDSFLFCSCFLFYLSSALEKFIRSRTYFTELSSSVGTP